MSDIVNDLVDMGYTRERAELAVIYTNGQNVESATQWLLSNEGAELSSASVQNATLSTAPTENVEEKANTEAPEKANTEAQEKEQSLEDPDQEQPQEAKSIKCDDCGKLFRTSTEMEFHAEKSGHSNFSESTEEKKPLTEEEKKVLLVTIESKLKLRRLEREARERQEEVERKKTRLRTSKDLLEAKHKQEDTEIKKELEQRKREKQEEKLARDRVKQQIEQDRLARKAKFGEIPEVEAKQPTPAAITPPKPAVVQNYSEVKLQIRLTNGSTLTQTFGAKEPLSAVRLYVEMNRTDENTPFALRTPFPNKLFESDDYDKPLELLGTVQMKMEAISREWSTIPNFFI